MSIKLVFLSNVGGYKRGEEAVVKKAQADAFVDGGWAVRVNPPKDSDASAVDESPVEDPQSETDPVQD